MRRAEPPRLWRRLLEACVRKLGTPDLADDAAELFVERAERHGERAARRWYGRQARAALGRHLFSRRRQAGPRRRRWSPGSAMLDAKVGVRLLARYPGLTVIGGLAMAFAIFVGATTFEFVHQNLDPRLPLPEGDRIVGLRYWDRSENEEVLPLASDVRAWREGLGAVERLGAFRAEERNAAVGGEVPEPVRVARMSAAGFRVAGVAPVLGRTLVEGDEEAGAPPVAVIGYGLWRTRFDGDPAAVGGTMRLGADRVTVVGVMPDGFAFPRDQEVWVPLDDADAADAPLRVFGRLAAGRTLVEAQAELEALSTRVDERGFEGREHAAAQVLPFVHSLMSQQVGLVLRAMIYQVNVLAILFVILVSANVALLMYARAATREREIVVRSALGASRGRIVSQLFIEALMLSLLAAMVGLAATVPALRWLYDQLHAMGGQLPFWMVPHVSPWTGVYAAALAFVSALVAGVMPAAKATGRDMHARLQRTAPGGGTLRLGGIWSGVIMTQIAATVVFAGVAGVVIRQAARSASTEAHFRSEQYIGVRLEMDRRDATNAGDSAAAVFATRYGAHAAELRDRLAANPVVAGVTLTERLPLKVHATARIELDGEEGAHTVAAGAVDADFFRVLDTPLLAGRAFDSRDAGRDVATVVVNASFVDEVLGGRHAIGRRIRHVNADGSEPGPWLEIVGVVQDLNPHRTTSLDLDAPVAARIYRPLDLARADAYPLHVVAHVPSGPERLLSTLGRTAEAVSPDLRLREVTRLDRANSDLAVFWGLWADLVLTISATALFLSLAGIYAVMSFTVARRRREIGIRVALGAKLSSVLDDIFRRPASQIAAGVGAGCVAVAPVVHALTSGRVELADGLRLLALGAAMLGVCALACVVPALRALRVQPSEALRTEL